MGTPIKDASIPDSAPTTLLLDKHRDFIAAYGTKKDDYVRNNLKIFKMKITAFTWVNLMAQSHMAT